MAEPWIWLQDNEDYGKANCGCELFQSFRDSGAAALLCPLHDSAPDLLAALEEIAERPAGAYSRDPVKYRDNVIADIQVRARAAIAKAKE